jgi:hypothetical protein
MYEGGGVVSGQDKSGGKALFAVHSTNKRWDEMRWDGMPGFICLGFCSIGKDAWYNATEY